MNQFNQHKPKTVFEERDELKRQIELLRSALDTARFTIAGMAESLGESRKLAAELIGDIEELTLCEDCGEDCEKLESNGCYPPRYCHGCQQKLVGQIVELRAQLAARNELDEAKERIVETVIAGTIAANAESRLNDMCPSIHKDSVGHAIICLSCEFLLDAEAAANDALDAAVTAYRQLTEPSDVMEKPAVKRGLAITSAAEDGRLAGVVEQIQELAQEVEA